jgi:hypothetical protein
VGKVHRKQILGKDYVIPVDMVNRHYYLVHR